MDDINAYNDAQVGAAARVVHAGCKSVLQEHFSIQPAAHGRRRDRRCRSPPAMPPTSTGWSARSPARRRSPGVLVHRGWKTDMVKLPQLLRGARRPASRHRAGRGGTEIAPAGAARTGRPTRRAAQPAGRQIIRTPTFHDRSLQSRDRPRHQQLRHRGDRSTTATRPRSCRSPRSSPPTRSASMRTLPSALYLPHPRGIPGRRLPAALGRRPAARRSSASSPATTARWCPTGW